MSDLVNRFDGTKAVVQPITATSQDLTIAQGMKVGESLAEFQWLAIDHKTTMATFTCALNFLR